MIDPRELAGAFRTRFGSEPRLYRAPGRVNLIGEHTDYNDGFVMPIALDRCTWVAAAPRSDRRLVVHSREYDQTVAFDLDRIAGSLNRRPARPGPVGAACHWTDYVRGMAALLDATIGADLLIASDVPIGAGLSSSAALAVACGYAFSELAGATPALDQLARVAQRAEHEFAGTRCGIMDQMIACHGREGAALLLDTRSLACRWLPLPPTVRVVVCNTMVRHQLASGQYNARRADCEAGVAVLARAVPSIRALRDVAMEQLDAVRAELPARVYRRCRHVITENARVEEAADALARGDAHGFGALMDASHQSLRDDYEVSCPELDQMVAMVRGLDGVHGARMTGGGFGGCAVALIDASADVSVRREVARLYAAATGLQPDVWVTTAGGGAGAWPLEPAPAA